MSSMPVRVSGARHGTEAVILNSRSRWRSQGYKAYGRLPRCRVAVLRPRSGMHFAFTLAKVAARLENVAGRPEMGCRMRL